MNISAEHTYINPIVLPDYPTLQVRSKRLLHDWGRAAEDFVSYSEIIKETTGIDDDPEKSFVNVFNSHYGRVPENDVRATADPTACYFSGRWYLYPTSGMMYDSDDLVHWKSHYDETWMPISAPMAPTVEEFQGLYYATSNNTPLHVSQTPLGPWKIVGDWTLPDGRKTLCGDPMIFADGDHLYLYFGLGSGILGVELDPRQPNHFLTMPKFLIPFNPENKWERFGANNEDWEKGFIEGSWMQKVGSTYYLIYSCSGTEFFNYAMGVYVSNSPLGDFKLQKRNPMSASRNGFIKGGGHGSVVKGPKDTLWIFYTIPVCVDINMERRIGMDPVGIDEEGNMYALTGCSTPQYVPGYQDHPEKGNDAGLVALTVFKPTYATSYAPGHYPLYAVDEALHTWWQPDEKDKSPDLEVLLQGIYHICAIRLMWKDIGLYLDGGVDPGPYQYIVEYSETAHGNDWKMLVDASSNQKDLTVDYRTFPSVQAARVRVRILGSPKGITPGLIDFTVFGLSTSAR